MEVYEYFWIDHGPGCSTLKNTIVDFVIESNLTLATDYNGQL